ncbi:GntR family transcriptional regulator [Flavilitoribacter nigricans]|uniref:GntR family transcriptional regulator n=1 Tax=Flavilitoribacter nigricans (strain ATCC 23147 / DSM 23189 / NBRC 102662 / NCIMB 1420 / SS-2) TaxID=1122177 RepID=A0A2D0NDM6_FLAN2|nr:GntR family transcriptional regulator [Flavilitoribacter nigricans]PHN06508.1 GntR family transcriptional regulator [Flavilitoribacter nigricans DSM 23189 = NBRC 102662]
MEFKTQKPIYRQIADYLLENVLSGELQAGDRIPSVRDMAAEVEVNPNTVVRTYSFLSDLDIIYNQRGIGYFIAEDARTRAYNFQKEVFIEEELPALFKNMDLLRIDFEELEALHQKLYPYEKQ